MNRLSGHNFIRPTKSFYYPSSISLIAKHGKFYSNELPTVPRKLDLLNSVEIPLVENFF